MRVDTFLLNQLLNSANDAIDKLDAARSRGDIEEFNHIKNFILDIKNKIEQEADNILK
jgi:hypothetical protein